LIKLLAPVTPFITEEIYQNLVVANDKAAPESIFHCDFPEIDESLVDEKLVNDVDQVIRIVKAGRALRNKSNIKIRQPLGELVIRPDASMSEESLTQYQNHIKEELNIKELTFISDDSELAQYELKVDFKKLGPKYGKDIPNIQNALANLEVKDVVKKVHAQLNIEVTVNGNTISLEPAEVVIETKAKENFVVAENDGALLGLNTQITEELLSEGIARDLVRQIQELRKEAEFEMNDRIRLFYEGSDKIKNVFTQHADYIKAETLSLEIRSSIAGDVFSKDVKLSGEAVKLGVKK